LRNQGKPKTCKRVGIYFLTINIIFMKRSKLFLGVTTGILAVVAFTAAKTARFTRHVAGYYYGGSQNQHCTLSGGAVGYTASGEGNPLTADNTSSSPLYSYNNGGSCVVPLFTGFTD
jgi:hypothetical protein